MIKSLAFVAAAGAVFVAAVFMLPETLNATPADAVVNRAPIQAAPAAPEAVDPFQAQKAGATYTELPAQF